MMIDLLENSKEEDLKVGSINHSLIQTRLIRGLPAEDKYIVATKLSLDVSSPDRQEMVRKHQLQADRELTPDICLFKPGEINYLEPDIKDVLRTDRVPSLCIEIISPSQSSVEILRKFRIYFALGVKSC